MRFVLAGVLREKIRSRASFDKSPTNYKRSLEDSIIDVVYDKNHTIKASFFRKCQEPVRGETTSILLSVLFILSAIGCRQIGKMASQSYSTKHQSTICVGLFRHSDWLSRYPHLKLE